VGLNVRWMASMRFAAEKLGCGVLEMFKVGTAQGRLMDFLAGRSSTERESWLDSRSRRDAAWEGAIMFHSNMLHFGHS